MNPPDRSHILTEQRNPRTMNLHRMSAADCVAAIAREDHDVFAALDRAGPAITAFVEAVEPGFTGTGRLIYLGAGTSGRLGVLDASEAPPTFQVAPNKVIGIIAGGDSSLRKSSEGREDEPLGAIPDLEALSLTANDAVLGIAAGGTTPYVLGALEWCATRGLRPDLPPSIAALARPITGLLACTPMPRPAFVDHLIAIETGPEVLTGSTRMKAGTATKLALNTISTTLMVRSGRVYENLMVDLGATNAKLRDRAARIVATLTGLSREHSLTLLDQAGGHVKTAVVMHRRGVQKPQAEKLLGAVAGRLEQALAE